MTAPARSDWVKWANQARWFPIQIDHEIKRQRLCGRQILPGPVHVLWQEAEFAYESYHLIWPTQTLQRLADRGGFSWMEYLALCATTRYLRAQMNHRERTIRQAHAYFYQWLTENAKPDGCDW